jgi:hypothetical protein
LRRRHGAARKWLTVGYFPAAVMKSMSAWTLLGAGRDPPIAPNSEPFMRKILPVLVAAFLLLGSDLLAQRGGTPPPSQPECGEGCGGENNPPGAFVIEPWSLEVFGPTATLVIGWCDDHGLDSTSRWVKINGVAQTTTYERSSYQGTCGAERKSTIASAAFNLGENTVEAHICDSDEVCATQQWTIVRHVGPRPIVSLAPYSADLQDFGRCAAACFAATYAQSTVPYLSLDTPRNVTLVYNGARAQPRPFVHVDVTHGGDSTNLPARYRLRIMCT